MTEEKKTRKPGGSAFKQQKLRACQPIITPKTIFPLFFFIAIIFTPLGGVLFYYSDKVSEIVIDYTFCDIEANETFSIIPSEYVSNSDADNNNDNTHCFYWRKLNITHPYSKNPNNITIPQCSIQFYLHKRMNPPIYLYYRLTNFFQNERVYVKSLDTDQLKGNDLSRHHLEKGGCESMAQIDGIIIYPCGLIANSLFNDTFSDLTRINNNSNNDINDDKNKGEIYQFISKGISNPTESAKYSPTKYNLTQIRPPPNWVLRYPNGTYTLEFPPINPKEDDHFQVWMHAAGLPIFRKLYGKNETQGLEIGYYQVDIDTVFPVKGYEGTKALVISTRSPIGGKNPFLGVAYIIVGCISGILGVLFTIKHFMHPKRLVKKRLAAWKIKKGKKTNE
ncbi:hypothetical protein Glove_9g285 [Diversispora epigaea]|uniref:Cell cycle control protein n=1 Tax=Diversispora epigaea TaxID=1348612 RepID=A0A397JSN9_9GLOM|nr:hypothetical protein Glove_9g285 [Diversispora epigaea]